MSIDKQDSIIATAIAIKMDGGCGQGRVGNGSGQCVPSKNRGKKFRERALQTAMVGLPIAAATLSLARQGQKIHKQWQESKKIKKQGESANQTVENIRESTRETKEQKKARREAYEHSGRDLGDKVDEMLRKKYPNSSYARQERPASKQTIDVKARTVDSAIVRQDWGKAFRPKKRGNLIRNLGVAGAAATGLYTFAGTKERREQSRQALSSVKNAIAKRMPKKRPSSSPPPPTPPKPPSSQSSTSSTGSKYSWKPPKDNDELMKRFNDVANDPIFDSLIATAIAIKMDGCKRGTVGNGRGQCVPAKGKRLRQAKAIAGGTFNAIDRGAGLIQKAAGTAAAIGVLNNLKTTVAKKPDPNAEKKSDSIATAIAIRQGY